MANSGFGMNAMHGFWLDNQYPNMKSKPAYQLYEKLKGVTYLYRFSPIFQPKCYQAKYLKQQFPESVKWYNEV